MTTIKDQVAEILARPDFQGLAPGYTIVPCPTVKEIFLLMQEMAEALEFAKKRAQAVIECVDCEGGQESAKEVVGQTQNLLAKWNGL